LAEDHIGTRPPDSIFQADRMRYRFGDGTYPAADGWLPKVAFITSDDTSETGDVQTILTTADAISEVSGSEGVWEVDLDSSGAGSPSTQAWQVGFYHWQEWVEKAGSVDRVTLRVGTMLLLKSYGSGALSGGADFRSWARISLANVEAAIQGKATKDQLSYSIAGRSLQRYTFAEWLELRDRLQALVDREDDLEAMRNDDLDGVGISLVEF